MWKLEVWCESRAGASLAAAAVTMCPMAGSYAAGTGQASLSSA